jgi:uncharacterized membrane protein YfcA
VLLLSAVLVVGVLSGATATVAGFGIGSMLTPLLATRYSMPIAVAAVSIPHAIATALRFWRLRASVSWPVIRSFGVLSAAGGLAGALLYTRFTSHTLTAILGALLVATSIAALTDWLRRLQPQGFVAQSLGFVSGLFGGIAGNQGGLRAGALLAFDLPPAAFVATATATGLAVDAARMPIYVWRAGGELVSLAAPIAVATVGVLIGTLPGERLLFGLAPEKFRRVVGWLVGVLGVWLLLAGELR